jgi:methylamine dehydrogenase accessory protein MauD
MNALTLSVILLWVAVIVLGLLVWALARQVGVLFERVAPMGALITDAGPAVGEAAPPMSSPASSPRPCHRRAAGPRHAAVLPVAHLPGVQEAAAGAQGGCTRRVQPRAVVLASDGDSAEHLAFVREQGLAQMPYLLSTELGMTYRVSRLPYGILLDAQGIVPPRGWSTAASTSTACSTRTTWVPRRSSSTLAHRPCLNPWSHRCPSLLRFIDRLTERGVRQVGPPHGRRSLLTRLGVLIAGGPLLPMLPFDRSRSGRRRHSRRAATTTPQASASTGATAPSTASCAPAAAAASRSARPAPRRPRRAGWAPA